MTDPLTAAREALARFDSDGRIILARRLSGQRKSAPMNRHLSDAEKYLRAALGEVDRLAADLAALRIEHEAHAALLSVTRAERDALRTQVAELTALGVSLHKATAKGTYTENAAIVAWAREHAVAMVRAGLGQTGKIVGEMADAIESGAHRGKA